MLIELEYCIKETGYDSVNWSSPGVLVICPYVQIKEGSRLVKGNSNDSRGRLGCMDRHVSYKKYWCGVLNKRIYKEEPPYKECPVIKNKNFLNYSSEGKLRFDRE